MSPFRRWARQLRQQTLIVYCAARDPRMPLPLRLLAVLIAGYALSPIDLIPDFIPVLGYLDDLLIVPLGLALVLRLTPPPILEAARVRAEALAARPASLAGACAIALVWALALALFGSWAWRWAV